MPANCAPQTISDDAACFLCLPEKTLTAMMVYLLAAILKEEQPMADITPQAIATASACYNCVSAKYLYAEIVYLLCQLTSGGGGGGGLGGVTNGTGAPPLDGSITTLFYKDTLTGDIYLNTGTVAVPIWDAV